MSEDLKSILLSEFAQLPKPITRDAILTVSAMYLQEHPREIDQFNDWFADNYTTVLANLNA